MELKDWASLGIALIAALFAGIAIRVSMRIARRQEEFSLRLKKVELRESKTFEIIDRGGELINEVEGKVVTLALFLSKPTYGTGDQVKALKHAIYHFGKHATNAEQHLNDELLAEFRKMVQANHKLYKEAESITRGDTPGKPHDSYTTCLNEWNPQLDEFKDSLKKFSSLADLSGK